MLKNSTIFITGATRGIGKAIALKAAKDGANIVVTGKTENPHPKLPGTIYETAHEIEQLGGKALPILMDVRDDAQVAEAVQKVENHFGGIDILINNASAISLTPVECTPLKKFDLMMDVNLRGTYALSQACLPFLKKAQNPHILTLSPPLSLNPKWFAHHTAYTISKFGMSMCVLGMAEEFRKYKISVNALWPQTIIGTAALQLLGDAAPIEGARTPEIVADAAYCILNAQNPQTGQFFNDEEVLKSNGINDFTRYAINPNHSLITDLFLDDFNYKTDQKKAI
jgi:citronellol/citronellal dehydrogenase